MCGGVVPHAGRSPKPGRTAAADRNVWGFGDRLLVRELRPHAWREVPMCVSTRKPVRRSRWYEWKPVNRILRMPVVYHGAKFCDRLLWARRLWKVRTEQRNRVALASFPRSGNTWMRYLLEAATGAATGSVYAESQGVMERGAEGLVVKTHACDSYRYTRAIILVRHPLDAISSYYHYRVDFGNASDSWEEFIRKAVPRWREFTLHWNSTKYDTLCIRFEDLKADAVSALRGVVGWLGVSLSHEQLVSAVQTCTLEQLRKRNPHTGERFFRQGRIGNGRDAFSPEQKAWTRACLGDIAEQFGYDLT